MSKIERWLLYGQMTDLGEIARRYFVMNFFDGVLTVLGIILGKFVIYLAGSNVTNEGILIPAISVAVAIGISGISGGYLAEKAERQKNVIEMKKSMVMSFKHGRVVPVKKKYREEDYYPKIKPKKSSDLVINNQNIDKVNVDPQPVVKTVEIIDGKKKIKRKLVRYKVKEAKTIGEEAESFATWFASIINGLAPAAGGLVGLIPFFIFPIDMFSFISAFVIMAITLFLLGTYLAKISNDSIWKYGILMVLAGIITAIISMLLDV